MNLAAIEMKAFVPARDLAKSTAFYVALGFEVPWSSDDLAYVRYGSTSFLLQRFFVPEHANNFMMHLLVENVDDWHRHILASGVAQQFEIRIEPLKIGHGAFEIFPSRIPRVCCGVLAKTFQVET